MNKIKKSVVDVALEDLNDAPDYTGNKNKIVSVKNDESGVEFINSFSEWATSINYSAGIIVKRNYSLYLCETGHTSGTFSTDWITNEYWVPLTDHPGIIKTHPVTDKIAKGWEECDGTQISRTTNADCFAIIGTTYGIGDDEFTFNIPDFASEADFLRHYKSGVSEAIGTHQGDEFFSHTHVIHIYWDYGASSGDQLGRFQIGTTQRGPTPSGSYATATGGAETRPKNYAIKYIIKIL